MKASEAEPLAVPVPSNVRPAPPTAPNATSVPSETNACPDVPGPITAGLPLASPTIILPLAMPAILARVTALSAMLASITASLATFAAVTASSAIIAVLTVLYASAPEAFVFSTVLFAPFARRSTADAPLTMMSCCVVVGSAISPAAPVAPVAPVLPTGMPKASAPLVELNDTVAD